MQLKPNTIHIFCDGASLVHKGKTGGWGSVLLYNGKSKEINGAMRNSTNNQMELLACIKALEIVHTTNIPIEIYSDSAYVINGMNDWRFKWQRNGWKTNKNSIKNRELWETLISLVEKQDDVTFTKVKGHAGITYNEKADELATNAIEEFLQGGT
jgi:ribonuclease HI